MAHDGTLVVPQKLFLWQRSMQICRGLVWSLHSWNGIDIGHNYVRIADSYNTGHPIICMERSCGTN